MFLIDTNVVSELMTPEPNVHVLEWFAFQEAHCLALTTIGIAESLVGIQRLPEGRTKSDLRNNFEKFRSLIKPSMILPFDERAAYAFAQVCQRRKSCGLHIDHADAQIAAIASVHGATIVTRNIQHFVEAGPDLLNPFAPA